MDIISGVASYLNSAQNTSGLTPSQWATNLPAMVNIDANLNSTAGARAAFSTIYGISTTNQTFGYTVMVGGVATHPYMDALSGVASYLTSAQNTSSMTAGQWAANLPVMVNINNAVASNNLRSQFATVYGISTGNQTYGYTVMVNGVATHPYQDALSGIASYMSTHSSYTIASFVAELPRMVNLDSALQSNGLRTNFATIYGVSTTNQTFGYTYTDPITGLVTHPYKDILAGTAAYMASNTDYTISSFVFEVQKLPLLDAALASNNLRTVFSAKNGILGSQQRFSNSDYKIMLSGTAGYMYTHQSTFTITDFVNELEALRYNATRYIGDLDSALTANGTVVRNAFADIYGIAVADQVMANQDYQDTLAQTSLYMSVDTTYKIADFIQGLKDYAASPQLVTNTQQMISADDTLTAGVTPADTGTGTTTSDTETQTTTTTTTTILGDTSVAQRIALKEQISSYSSSASPLMVTKPSPWADLKQQAMSESTAN
jgi:hypothetical protein